MKLLVNLALAASSIAVALLLSEALVRVWRPQLTYRYPRGLFLEDPLVGYRLHPHFQGEIDTPEYRTTVRVNGQGLREDREYGPKPPGVLRVLMLGDSFIMGVGVDLEETIAKILEHRLNARGSDPRVEVLNAGVAGYGTVQEAAYLSGYGLNFQPDLVMLGFFVGNDVFDNGSTAPHVEDGYLLDANANVAGILPVDMRRFLSLNSQLYHLLLPYKQRLFGGAHTEADERSTEFTLMYGSAVSGTTDLAPAWQATFDALARLAALGRSLGVPIAVVLIPERAQVSEGLWKTALDAMGGAQAGLRALAPNERLRTASEALGMRVLDLLPVLGGRNAADLYFEQDHHLTRVGNQAAADALEPFARELVNSASHHQVALRTPERTTVAVGKCE